MFSLHSSLRPGLTGTPLRFDTAGRASGAATLSHRHFQRGDVVTGVDRRMQPAVLVRGAVRIDRPGAPPEDLQLALPGDLLGLETLYGWTPQSTARALVDCELAPLRRMSDSEWREVLLHALMRRQSLGGLAQVRAGPAGERVRRLLLLLAGGPEAGLRPGAAMQACELPALADIAAITATAQETVSRVLSSLRRMNLLEDCGGRRVRLAPGLLPEAGELPGGLTRSRTRD